VLLINDTDFEDIVPQQRHRARGLPGARASGDEGGSDARAQGAVDPMLVLREQ
jgi:hypothetical protein